MYLGCRFYPFVYVEFYRIPLEKSGLHIFPCTIIYQTRGAWPPALLSGAWRKCLDRAVGDFSGYVAADELYDDTFCILTAVDNRLYKRLLYDVLDHDPTHE